MDGIKVAHNTGKSPVKAGGPPVTLAVGDVVSVKGGLGSAECEKQISAHDLVRASTGTFTAAPLTVTAADLMQSYNSALYASTPAQLLALPETGRVSSLTTNTITDSGKNWAVNQWKNTTVFLPGTANHTNLYYYVISNSVNTLTIAHRAIRRDFNDQPNLVTDGVQAGDSYEFVGGEALGPRLDGWHVRTTGTVTAVNAAAQYFDISDGGALGEIRTLQDIWDRINYGSVWTPPAGLRVKWTGTMPAVGARLSVTGFAGADRFKYQVTTTVDPNNSARDEVKVDKTYPVLSAWSFVPSTEPPLITGQPQSASSLPGQSVTFSVTAIGGTPLAYQWRFNDRDIADATSSALTISSVRITDAGVYSVNVTNAYGSAVSSNARLALIVVAGAGDNTFGQTNVPVLASNLIAVAAGAWHSLGLGVDGTVVAWGNNWAGQCAVPPTLTNAVAIAAGGYHNLAIRAERHHRGVGRGRLRSGRCAGGFGQSDRDCGRHLA